MNIDPESQSAPASESTPEPVPTPEEAPAPPNDWRYWMRRLLVCNPFFLCSAALLLYAVNRLSSVDSLFAGEIQNLLFNFSALQFYETLVVIAGLILARRRIWYDSSLLVVVEQGLVLVPFLLITQATVQGQELREGMNLALPLALAGVAATAGRMLAIRRGFPEFNLPSRALLLGAVILAGNVVLPLIFRVRMERDLLDWQEENELLWYVILPAIVLAANLLPKPQRYGGSNPQRHWLPIFIYALWLTGSAVHVWSIAHICSLPLSPHHLAPLACALVWTLWHRLHDFLPNPPLHLRRAILALALLAPLLAFTNSYVFTALAICTHVGFVALWLRSTNTWPLRSAVGHLAIAALSMAFAGIPIEWARAVIPLIGRPGCIAIASSIFTLLLTARSRFPVAGVAATAAAALAMTMFTGAYPSIHLHTIVQTSAVFLMLHSIRWVSKEPIAENLLRIIAAGIWLLDAALWTGNLRGDSFLFSTIAASVVFTVWWFCRDRASRILVITAFIVACCAPAHWLSRNASAGALALLGSLALFAAGMIVAWTRHRWEGRDKATLN